MRKIESLFSCSTSVTSYDGLLTALTEGRQLTLTGIATDCVNSLPPEVVVAEGGSTYYQYYVVSGSIWQILPFRS